MPVVYVATNIANGHSYIGASKYSMEKRRRHHIMVAYRGRGASCKVFHAAIRKHGPDAFEWDVLSDHATADEAFEAERAAIAMRKPEYNVSAGGKNPFSDLPRTDEWKAKISAAHKGKKQPQEQREANGRRKRGVYRRPVICLDDDREFAGPTEAAAFYGLRRNAISGVCCGAGCAVGGRHFAFPEEVVAAGGIAECLRIRLKAKASNRADGGIKRRVRVMRLDDGVLFDHAGDAAAAHGVTAGAIGRLCTGKGGGLEDGTAFAYAADAPNEAARLRLLATRRTIREAARTRLADRNAEFAANRRPVLCVETGQIFLSISAASRVLRVAAGNLSMVLRGHRPHAGGLTFCYAEVSV